MDFTTARINMISQQLRTMGVLAQNVLDIIGKIPREEFVPSAYEKLAYAEMAIPLEHSQYMLLPQEQAWIVQALQVQPHERVLEIGTGSGYLTALLASLAQQVDSIDIFPDFTQQALLNLQRVGLQNVNLITADAACGWGKPASYHAIAITGSLPFLPDNYRSLLTPDGRILAILGKAPAMVATLFTRTAEGWKEERLFETVVTPLINAPQPATFAF